MSGVELRRRVSTEQQPQSHQHSPQRKDDFTLSEVKVHENSGSGKNSTDCCGCATDKTAPASGRVRKAGRMETVTVTVGIGGGCQGETEATTRERKISRVRKISNALNDIVTMNHGGGCQSEMDGTPRERKISKVRKISDALVSIVTMNNQNHHGPTVIGTLSSQRSVSLADLLKAEEELDTRSVSSGSIEYPSGGITNLAYKKDDGKDGENGGMGPGHVLGTGPSSETSGDWGDGKQWPQVVASIAGKNS